MSSMSVMLEVTDVAECYIARILFLAQPITSREFPTLPSLNYSLSQQPNNE